jgi:hypothetical protein
MSKKVSAQLLYSFSKFLEREILQIYEVNRVDGISTSELDLTCFVEVLFCEAITDSTSSEPYEYPGFRYKFRTIDDPYLWDGFTRRRSRVYNSTTRYYKCDKDKKSIVNIFRLKSDDLLLIRKLLEYKQTGSTDISGIIYGNLTTNLSKLIYLYLDLKVNNDYSLYNNNILISDATSILESMFEYYLIQEMFRQVSGLG